MFIAILLITVQTWKQPTYPLITEWRKKLYYMQTMEYYLALRRNEVSSHKKILRNLKCILLNKKSQSEKLMNTYCMITTVISEVQYLSVVGRKE